MARAKRPANFKQKEKKTTNSFLLELVSKPRLDWLSLLSVVTPVIGGDFVVFDGVIVVDLAVVGCVVVVVVVGVLVVVVVGRVDAV
jgi:hypothetical protein